MEAMISNLLSRFEQGRLSRRDLVQGLAMLAGSGAAASAQRQAQTQEAGLQGARIDHVSIQERFATFRRVLSENVRIHRVE